MDRSRTRSFERSSWYSKDNRSAKKKSIRSKFGTITLSKNNPLVTQQGGQKISPYLKEKLVYIGQLECYEKGSEVAEKLMNVQTNDTAIYRLTDKIGSQCKTLEESEQEDFRVPIELKAEEYLYVESDGSMLLTRTSGWKEVKLGRIFKSTSIHTQSADRQWLRDSEYVAHLGSHKNFEDQMSKLIDDPYKKCAGRIVFLTDGAKWQWNWVEAEYPKAIQILDFYHAMEHLGMFIKVWLKNKEEVKKMMKKLGHILKHKGVVTLTNYLSNIPRKTKAQKDEYAKLMTYINNNQSRMDYPKYISKGLLIGSGAIESAHRTVLQKRMKLSGQRWSPNGLENMIKLRTIKMSGYWDKIVSIIRNAA